MKVRSLVLGGVLLAGTVAACSGGDEGEPGPSIGSSSGQGTSSGGTATGDGGTGSNPNGTVGCKDGTECASGTCFVGKSQSFCSVKCTTATESTLCVTPLTGTCNMQGYCKRD